MILLLGASGYVGQAFAAELRKRGINFTPVPRQALDYTRFDALFRYVRGARPEFIINAAGYTGVADPDDCETHRSEALRANTLLPQTIARVCYLTNTALGHVSSGSIFSGAKIVADGHTRIERNLDSAELREQFERQPEIFRGFDESDEPNFSFRSPPCSFYSGTKALAEEALRGFRLAYLWRPGIVFDHRDHRRNFLSQVRQSGKVHDGAGSLSHCGDFARACLDLWERAAPFGVYHVVNPGALTGREVAAAIQRKFNAPQQFKFRPSDEELFRLGVRTRHSTCLLGSSKLLAAGTRLRPAVIALEDALEAWSPAELAACWQPATRRMAHRR